jgi:hypothetical protein
LKTLSIPLSVFVRSKLNLMSLKKMKKRKKKLRLKRNLRKKKMMSLKFKR